MGLPPPTPPLASYVGLVVTFVVVTAIGLLARHPQLGGLLTTFPGKIPALILALLLAGRPDEAVRVAGAGPLGLAAVAVFAAGVSMGIAQGTRRALALAFGGWGVAVVVASLLPVPSMLVATSIFGAVWLACLLVAARGAGAGSPPARSMGVREAMTKAVLPALLVFAALWIQPATGPVLAAALTVLPVNTSSALAHYRGDPGSVRRAMLASVANLLSSLAFLAAFVGLVAWLGTRPAAVAAAVLLAWGAAALVTLAVKAGLDRGARRAP